MSGADERRFQVEHVLAGARIVRYHASVNIRNGSWTRKINRTRATSAHFEPLAVVAGPFRASAAASQ
jgi:hypothetical protein